jgi:hypothetical protein
MGINIPKIKTIEPKDDTVIWEVDIKTERGEKKTRLVGPEEAEEFMKAGFPIKLRTTVGKL